MKIFTAEPERDGRAVGALADVLPSPREPNGAISSGAVVSLCGTAALGCAEVKSFLLTVYSILRAAVREIFDESAYERYLAHAHKTRSTASYRAFLQERQAGIARRPRCC